jgi:F-type H+-transporting ATPase subunit b
MGPLKIDTPDLVLGLVLFFVVFGMFALVLLPRIANVIAQREELINGGLEKAEKQAAEAERIAAEGREIIAEARRAAVRERQRQIEEGTALLTRIREEGVRQREELVATGLAKIAADRALAEAELRHDVGTLAVQLAGRVVGEPLDEMARDSALVDRFFAELEPRDTPVTD